MRPQYETSKLRARLIADWKRRAYPLRMYATWLGVSESTVHLFVHGDRGLSYETGKVIEKFLENSPKA